MIRERQGKRKSTSGEAACVRAMRCEERAQVGVTGGRAGAAAPGAIEGRRIGRSHKLARKA